MSLTNKQQAYQKGVMSEKLASRFLCSKGYEILQERYKTKYGEIDLVATKGEYLIAVEVKARDTVESALEAVTLRSRKRIEQAMLYFLSQNPEYANAAIRFDVIAISGSLSIHHLDNAWRPEA